MKVVVRLTATEAQEAIAAHLRKAIPITCNNVRAQHVIPIVEGAELTGVDVILLNSSSCTNILPDTSQKDEPTLS